MAVVCASLPAMNHFFRNVLQETKIGSAMKSWSNKYSAGSSDSRSRSKGYGRTTSQTDDDRPFDSARPHNAQKSIHIVQEVKLEEFLDDKKYDRRYTTESDEDKQWAKGTNFVDQVSVVPPKGANTWLEDDTSSGDDASVHGRHGESSRKHPGFADARRFY